jgi:hypothetical protein
MFHPASTAAEQADTLTALADNNKAIDAWWDLTWQKTFQPGAATGGSNITDYIFNNIVRWFLLVGSLFWIWQIGLASASLAQSGGASWWDTFAKAFWPVFIVVALLANNAEAARSIGWTVREFGQSAQKGILDASISDITIRSAMQDIFVTQTGAAQIAEQVQYCAAMPHPNVILPNPERPTDPDIKLNPQQEQAYDYLECARKVQSFAEEVQAQGEQKSCTSIAGIQSSCTLFTRFMKKTIDSLSSAVKDTSVTTDRNAIYNVMTDYMRGLAAGAAYRPILAFIQYWTVSFFEIALWTDALIAPMAIAVAIVPARLNMTTGWLISMLTIVLAQITNTFVSGIAALQLSQSSTYFLSDSRFDMALGLVAPLVSFAVIGGGGFFAAKTFMSTGGAVVSTATGIGASLVSAVTMGMSRAIARKR